MSELKSAQGGSKGGASTPRQLALGLPMRGGKRRGSGRFLRSRGRFRVRLAEYTVLGNHVHLVVEADDSVSLSRGIQGLCIRLARALNALLESGGPVFADHFRSRILRTPTELCGAIRYLRENAAHHYGERGVDGFSSAAADAVAVLVGPIGWLLRVGWQRALIPIAPATFEPFTRRGSLQ